MGKGGASFHDALPSFDPAFSLRKKSTGYGPIFFPPVLPLSSPSRPGFVYHRKFINLFKNEGRQGNQAYPVQFSPQKVGQPKNYGLRSISP